MHASTFLWLDASVSKHDLSNMLQVMAMQGTSTTIYEYATTPYSTLRVRVLTGAILMPATWTYSLEDRLAISEAWSVFDWQPDNGAGNKVR